jgi:hypothetical protein
MEKAMAKPHVMRAGVAFASRLGPAIKNKAPRSQSRIAKPAMERHPAKMSDAILNTMEGMARRSGREGEL